MAKEVTRFIADNGTEHATEFDAWKADFKNWLITNGADNEAIAAKIVKTVDDGRPESLDTLAAIVAGMRESAPPVVRATADMPRVMSLDDAGKVNPFASPARDELAAKLYKDRHGPVLAISWGACDEATKDEWRHKADQHLSRDDLTIDHQPV